MDGKPRALAGMSWRTLAVCGLAGCALWAAILVPFIEFWPWH